MNSAATSPPVVAPPKPPVISATGPTHANKRNLSDFKRANRHSIFVSVLRKALPSVAFFIVATFIVSAVISYTPGLNNLSAELALEGGKLVMKEPKLAGVDKNDRAYDVRAFRAIQDLTNPGTVELEKIDAKLPIGANAFAHVDADAGSYDTTNEKLNLRDNVTVKSARGMNIAMEEADIDIKTGEMVSQKPVSVTSNDADISANSVKVTDNGKRILFKDRVKMTIRRTTPPPQNNPSSN